LALKPGQDGDHVVRSTANCERAPTLNRGASPENPPQGIRFNVVAVLVRQVGVDLLFKARPSLRRSSWSVFTTASMAFDISRCDNFRNKGLLRLEVL